VTTVSERYRFLKKFKDSDLFSFHYRGVLYNAKVSYENELSVIIQPSDVETSIIIPLRIITAPNVCKLKNTHIDDIIHIIRDAWSKIHPDRIREIMDMIPLNSFVLSGDFF